jgi:hypothetical protein
MKNLSLISGVLTKAKYVAPCKENLFCSHRMHILCCTCVAEEVWWSVVKAQNLTERVLCFVPD